MVVRRIEAWGDAFVAENATVLGDVTLEAGVSVWFGCVLRGDDAPIRVGRNTNLQDLTMVHADPGVPSVVEDEVTVGHHAVLHGVRIGRQSLIGMGAILLAGSEIGAGSVIGAGAVVTEGMIVPPRSLVLGVPGKVVREVTDEELAFNVRAAADYVVQARAHYSGRFL